MKRIRITLMSITIVAAVCSAFVTKKMNVVCEDCPQFYFADGQYYPVQGIFGLNYDCEDYNDSVTCTYYRPDPAHPNIYAACRMGHYVFVGNINKNEPGQAKK